MNYIEIGAFTGIYGGTIGHSAIGRYCSIAPGVDIASDQHPTSWLSTSMVQYVHRLHGWSELLSVQEEYLQPFEANSRVHVGNDVWIGQGVYVNSGVTIGDGAVIAAHAAVVKDVPPYAIVGGVPAKLIKFRFPDRLIERMLQVRWWQYNVLGLDLNFSDPDRALDQISMAVSGGSLLPFEGVLLDQYGRPTKEIE